MIPNSISLLVFHVLYLRNVNGYREVSQSPVNISCSLVLGPASRRIHCALQIAIQVFLYSHFIVFKFYLLFNSLQCCSLSRYSSVVVSSLITSLLLLLILMSLMMKLMRMLMVLLLLVVVAYVVADHDHTHNDDKEEADDDDEEDVDDENDGDDDGKE